MSGFRQVQVMFAFGVFMLLPGIIFVLCGGRALVWFRGAGGIIWDAIIISALMLALIASILASMRGRRSDKFKRKKHHRIIYFICAIAMASCITASFTNNSMIFSAVMVNVLIQAPLIFLAGMSVNEQFRTP